MTNIHVAVYGTLKRGFSNSSYLMDSQFLGNGVTKDKFQMFDTGGFPVIFHGEHAPVVVEAYGIQGDVLCCIDELEWNGRMFVRSKYDVLIGTHRSKLTCFIYLGVEDFWRRKMTGLRQWEPQDGVLNWQPYTQSQA